MVRGSSVVWKTRRPLPPDCPSGTYCCKVQWFQCKSLDNRVFVLASSQYISLSCIVPAQFPIVLTRATQTRTGTVLYELSECLQQKILTTLKGLVIDD